MEFQVRPPKLELKIQWYIIRSTSACSPAFNSGNMRTARCMTNQGVAELRFNIPMLITKTIEKGDLILRCLTMTDATENYLSWLQDPEVNAFLEGRFNIPESVTQLAGYIRETVADPDSLLLGIFKKKELSHIGNIKLGPINRRHRIGEVGFLIGEKKEWGKGYASCAIIMLCDYAFYQLDLVKINAGCYEENAGSRRALLKAGFIAEGRQSLQWETNGKRQAGLIFGKVNPKHVE